MNNFILSYQALLKKYRLDIGLLFIAIVTTIGSLFILLASTARTPEAQLTAAISPPTAAPVKQKIIVDIQGAVKNPDAYSVDFGARLKDIILLAGGLSSEADKNYFAQHFNLAEQLSDEQKLYVPSKEDVLTGLFDDPKLSGEATSTLSNDGKININTASRDELDSLPGVGAITVDKILESRPYSSPDQLLSSKVIGQSTYDKIKDLITAI